MSTETWLISQLDGRLTDKLATAWEWDASGTTLHLTLRPNVYFHDGTRLTPEVAVQAFRESQASARRPPSSFSTVQSVTGSGADGIEIRLSEPNSFFLPDLSLVSVLKPGLKPDQPQVGTGPFRVILADKQHAVLQAFDKHYRERPAFPQLEITNYPTQRNAWAALMRGDIDVLYEVGRDVADLVQTESKVRMYTFPRPYYNTLVFNVRHPVLKKAAVRRALNEALDRATLIRDGLNGQGRSADGPLVPEHWAYSPPRQPFDFNLPAARLGLENAGLRIRPGVAGKMPSRFAFTCLVFADDPRFERLAVLVAKQLAEVGVDMRLEPLPYEKLLPRLASGDFDAFLFEMSGTRLSWVYELWHSSNQSRFSNGYRSVDAVLDRIRGARTEEEIRGGVVEMQQILHDDPPAAFLAWQTTSRAVSTAIDVAQEPGRDVLSNIWVWRPAAPGPKPR